jgi:hypothetical protein
MTGRGSIDYNNMEARSTSGTRTPQTYDPHGIDLSHFKVRL